MRYAMELIYSGVAIGAIYGLMAMAFAMTYKATGLLNFAQGELGMLIAYMAWSISVALGTSTWALIGGALVSSVLLGLMIEKFIMRKMIGQPVFSAVLVTVGLGVIITSLVLMIWGGEQQRIDTKYASDIVMLGGLRMRVSQITVIVVLALALLSTHVFFRYSRFGIAMRAVAADQRTASLMGISVARVQSVAWATSSVLAGLAGLFFAVSFELSPSIFSLGLKSFPATVVGGLDAVIGSGASGIFIGVFENLVGGYIAPLLKEIAGFLLILIILMVRPFGLFGQKDIERV
ncbi:MAG: branched-chain amino acid ABC transporter permease [Polaromonas sp.]|uniref:branched-chain amino acid ABC transporter permease n=1 Tax=Polaromonas sp. TaxID=1869339 RepID=UPI0027371A19|nr:branched-chain amino acid ABC transporter permease [Polaromonas sp.]MDP3799221.1 branched-chain amino acid ABC transporter permease [Polaromonas sp.]